MSLRKTADLTKRTRFQKYMLCLIRYLLKEKMQFIQLEISRKVVQMHLVQMERLLREASFQCTCLTRVTEATENEEMGEKKKKTNI